MYYYTAFADVSEADSLDLTKASTLISLSNSHSPEVLVRII